MVKSRYIGDGHPTFNRNPYNGYINPYHWVDDHPLLYGNNGSLDPGTYIYIFMKGNSHSPPMEKLAIHLLNVAVCAENISRAIFVQLESDHLWGSRTFSTNFWIYIDDQGYPNPGCNRHYKDDITCLTTVDGSEIPRQPPFGCFKKAFVNNIG